jgi:hypothetical protein
MRELVEAAREVYDDFLWYSPTDTDRADYQDLTKSWRRLGVAIDNAKSALAAYEAERGEGGANDSLAE